MRLTPEIKLTDGDPRDTQNMRTRNTILQNFSKMNFRSAADPAKLVKSINNAVLLSAEEHVFGAEKDGTRYDGLPGCTNAKDPCIFTVPFTQIYGINFAGTVSIAQNATVIFTNCRFANTIAMTAGAKAQFIGPYFYNVGSVQNVGIPANAYILGSVKKSGVSHTNVTVISELT